MARRKPTDFRSEIESHIELEADRLVEQGLSREDARRAAKRTFGNLALAQERFYEARRWLWWDRLRQDIRFCARMLRKSPAFTLIAVVTMALGIGTTTAIFSVVNATLLSPLPYPQPQELVSIQDDLPGNGANDVGLSQPEWQDLQRSGIFEYVSPGWYDENNLTGASQPARVSLLIVAPDYFALLGVKPQLGRAFDPRNYSPGFVGEVVISDGLWKRSFGGDPHIVGRTLRMDTDEYQVVGVMPPGFHTPARTPEERNTEVWAATSFYGAPLQDVPPRNRRNLPEAIGRIKPGLTLAEAQSRVDALVASLQREYPGDYPAHTRWRIRLLPLKDVVVGNVGRSLVLLLGAVVLVLLIGCVNLANLLLARASTRRREMALRQALGAARGRLIRQLLTESVMLSLLGGAAGLLLLFATQHSLVRWVPDSVPRLSEVSISWGVLAFALLSSLLAGGIFGLAPAFHASRIDLVRTLKEAARGSTGPGEQARARRALVVAEFALALVLMTAACLLLRSFWELLKAPLGFDATQAMTVRTRLPYPNNPKLDRYATAAQEAPFVRELLRGARMLPGVEEAALGDSGAIPLDQSQKDLNLLASGRFFFRLEGRDGEGHQVPWAERVMVTPSYFHVLRIPLLRGRMFNDADDDKAPLVAVVDESFARSYWPNEDAVGKRFRRDRAGSPWETVVGVVANARTDSLAQAAAPQIYVSLFQVGTHHIAIFLRGQLDPSATPEQVRQMVQSVDPTLPVFGAHTIEETVAASLSQRRFSLQMVALFAATALLLTAIGIYGVISYMVSARTHEIGIRVALGATRTNIQRLVLAQGLGLALLGAAIGTAVALLVSHLMAGVLYGVRPSDPATFLAVSGVLLLVALLACYLPARRAVRVDPLVALRSE